MVSCAHETGRRLRRDLTREAGGRLHGRIRSRPRRKPDRSLGGERQRLTGPGEKRPRAEEPVSGSTRLAHRRQSRDQSRRLCQPALAYPLQTSSASPNPQSPSPPVSRSPSHPEPADQNSFRIITLTTTPWTPWLTTGVPISARRMELDHGPLTEARSPAPEKYVLSKPDRLSFNTAWS